MITVSISEARARFSELVKAPELGAVILITRRGKLAAQRVAISKQQIPLDEPATI
jgi:prevent-host-death family protein